MTIQERKKDLAALTVSNGGVSEADLDSTRLQVGSPPLKKYITDLADVSSICEQLLSKENVDCG